MKHDTFLSLFPTPRYLKMPAVGIDISDHTIKYVELLRDKYGLGLGRYGEVKIPKGAIVSGKIEKPEQVIQVLSKLRKTYGFTYANVSLPEDDIFIVSMEVPVVRKSELRGAIELHIEEHVPLSVKDVVFDFDVVREGKNSDNASFYEVIVSAASLETVRQYMQVLERSDIAVRIVEPESHSLARSIVPEGKKGNYMVVDIGRMVTNLSIVCGGVVRFSSSIAIGGEAITQAIMKDSGVTYNEAIELKEQKGMDRSGENRNLFATVVRIATILRDEINTRFYYWNNRKEAHTKQEHIEHIYLAGGNANIKGISDYLTSGVDATVSVGNPWVNILSFNDHIPSMHASESLRYCVALGLAKRGMKR